MPLLEESVIKDITCRLQNYLKSLGNYGEPTYLNAGGSAAIYKVDCKEGIRVFKVFNPSFFNGPSGEAERRRLEVQRHLIGHKCTSLVQTYRVEEVEGTAFIEMEFVSWPQLTEKLADIPDDAVTQLIMQLVNAVRYLETQGIVHRDIKPDNIHISPDYQSLILLDLGVAREFEVDGSEGVAITDHGNNRPFLATAQYSSPEYLFRLDEPTVKLWNGLNFYQVGAVLHDLIMKRPIFHHEMSLANRWLVARAVLSKTPSFSEANPLRLASLKALSARCLAKDLNTRLQLVGWDDFDLAIAHDPLAILKGRLAKGITSAGVNAKASVDARLEFDRAEFARRFTAQVRSELISACGTSMPFTLDSPLPNAPPIYKFKFSISDEITIDCYLHVEWGEELYCRTANIMLSARLVIGNPLGNMPQILSNAVCSVVIGEAEEEAVHSICARLAVVISHGLDVIESAGNDPKLNGMDLL